MKPIAEIAIGNNDFITLLFTVVDVRLLETISGNIAFTIFATTNTIFAKYHKHFFCTA